MAHSTDGSATRSASTAFDTVIDEAALGVVPLAATLEGVIRNELESPELSTSEGLNEAALGVEPLLDSLDGVVHGVTGASGAPPDSVVNVAACRQAVTLPSDAANRASRLVTTLVLTP